MLMIRINSMKPEENKKKNFQKRTLIFGNWGSRVGCQRPEKAKADSMEPTTKYALTGGGLTNNLSLYTLRQPQHKIYFCTHVQKTPRNIVIPALNIGGKNFKEVLKVW